MLPEYFLIGRSVLFSFILKKGALNRGNAFYREEPCYFLIEFRYLTKKTLGKDYSGILGILKKYE